MMKHCNKREVSTLKVNIDTAASIQAEVRHRVGERNFFLSSERI